MQSTPPCSCMQQASITPLVISWKYSVLMLRVKLETGWGGGMEGEGGREAST